MPIPTMIDVSLVAVPEAGTSLLGATELLNSVGVAWSQVVESATGAPLYRARIVGESRDALAGASQWTVHPDAAIAEVERTDVVFIPSLWVLPGETFAGRHAALREWIVRQYHNGALVCSACTGTMLLAETGLLDGQAATTHWAYEQSMRQHYPRIELHIDKVLIESGTDGRLITSGSHATWYDALLYLIARTGNREAAMQTAKFLLLQWHSDGQSPYRAFQDHLDHGDAVIRECQTWLRRNFTQPGPVELVERQSGLASRSFKRRFKLATGMTVIDYVQRLRVEHAKILLEGGDAPVEGISWRVGYEDVAFFRRLFKRETGLTPREYRKKFKLPTADAFPRVP